MRRAPPRHNATAPQRRRVKSPPCNIAAALENRRATTAALPRRAAAPLLCWLSTGLRSLPRTCHLFLLDPPHRFPTALVSRRSTALLRGLRHLTDCRRATTAPCATGLFNGHMLTTAYAFPCGAKRSAVLSFDPSACRYDKEHSVNAFCPCFVVRRKMSSCVVVIRCKMSSFSHQNTPQYVEAHCKKPRRCNAWYVLVCCNTSKWCNTLLYFKYGPGT